MDKLSSEILKELLPQEKEVILPASARTKNAGARLDHWTPAILLERAAYLREMARHGNGEASETLKEYPRHFTMLLYRSRDGVAELHEHYADLFYVLAGRATLVTGGRVAKAKTIGPGEIRGASIEGGTRQELKPGDVAHVPAGLAHQMLVSGEQTLTCFVVKMQESE